MLDSFHVLKEWKSYKKCNQLFTCNFHSVCSSSVLFVATKVKEMKLPAPLLQLEIPLWSQKERISFGHEKLNSCWIQHILTFAFTTWCCSVKQSACISVWQIRARVESNSWLKWPLRMQATCCDACKESILSVVLGFCKQVLLNSVSSFCKSLNRKARCDFCQIVSHHSVSDLH